MFLLESLPEVIINKIKSYVIFTPNNKELKKAVNLWCEDKTKAYKLFGHISFWDTKQVTNMYKLFFSKLILIVLFPHGMLVMLQIWEICLIAHLI